jgi:hypothetical protein
MASHKKALNKKFIQPKNQTIFPSTTNEAEKETSKVFIVLSYLDQSKHIKKEVI